MTDHHFFLSITNIEQFDTAEPTSFSTANESPFVAYEIGTIAIHTDDACVVTISSPDQTVLFTITDGTQRPSLPSEIQVQRIHYSFSRWTTTSNPTDDERFLTGTLPRFPLF
jgi:hypothetical protein